MFLKNPLGGFIEFQPRVPVDDNRDGERQLLGRRGDHEESLAVGTSIEIVTGKGLGVCLKERSGSVDC